MSLIAFNKQRFLGDRARQGTSLLDAQGILGPGLGKLTGGSKRPSSVPLSGVGTVVEPLHWFDLTDTSVLWQNSGGTTPADEDNDPVARIDNKGTSAFTLQSVTGTPEVETTGVPAGQATAMYWDGASMIENTNMPDAFTQDLAGGFAVVFVAEEGTANTFVAGWDTFEYTVRHNADDAVFGAAFSESLDIEDIPVDTWQAALITANAGAVEPGESRLEFLSSWDGILVDEAATLAPNFQPNAGEEVYIGGTDGAAFFTGWVGEVIFWDGALTADEKTSFQDYVNTKYGITWS